MHIIDRWGRAIFKFDGEPVENLWNGNSGSSKAPDGVYFWVVKYKDMYGKKYSQRGTVTILR
jgi:hypothetical protein